MTSEKSFKDSVHGYISIPSSYCTSFIDDPLFQRLRSIEQTSMRVLFPSARHDRFVHSLGVFHIGKQAFNHIRKNAKASLGKEFSNHWDEIQASFEIACLMHDIGHAPFSHTFEEQYVTDGNRKKVDDLFNEVIIEKSLDFNIESDTFEDSSPHEQISALLVLTRYYDRIEKLNADPEFIARMITGYEYDNEPDNKQRLRNCFINLLNGFPLDVDKLDYIVRDTWMSGIKSVGIDTDRILSSLTISMDEDKIPTLCFKKRALSVIQNVVDGRNYLFKWVYGHHIVKYEQYLLQKSVNTLSEQIGNKFRERFFSYNSLIEPDNIDQFHFFMPTDGDIQYLLKKHISDIPEAKELLSRNYEYKALWKTDFEFSTHFSKLSNTKREAIKTRLMNDKNFIVIPSTIKLLEIDENEIKIFDNGELIPYKNSSSENNQGSFFYVYVKNRQYKDKDELIKQFRTMRT